MSRIALGTFAAVIQQYLFSPKFKALAPATQASYRRFLVLAQQPDQLGTVPVDQIRPALVQEFLDRIADRPGNQSNAKTALRALERWAVVRDLLPRQITLGTETVGSSGGHEPWTEAQIAYAEAHCRPHLARVIALGAGTGQRGSDLVRMRWTDIEEHEGIRGINVTQKKTGLKLWIPFPQRLLSAMSTWERRPGFILLKRDGRPFTRTQLSDQWETERALHEPLRDLVLHGLRGSCAVRLRRAGATISQICDMVGMSPQMVKRYCRFSDQRTNAIAAVHLLDGTAAERGVDFTKKPPG